MMPNPVDQNQSFVLERCRKINLVWWSGSVFVFFLGVCPLCMTSFLFCFCFWFFYSSGFSVITRKCLMISLLYVHAQIFSCVHES
ncbi:hypothetical protein KP509_09G070100 [Ceratopteris richardii]|nr:hypothetical protein KP509_09G070100 [Ceratopteris richardii]